MEPRLYMDWEEASSLIGPNQ